MSLRRPFIPAVLAALVFLSGAERAPEQTYHLDERFFLPDDLEITLWAESPLFFNPTNLDVDAEGRVWVTEAVNYRDFNNAPEEFKHFPQGDRVVVLEDTDGDGKADSSRTFVQDADLTAPLGVAKIGEHVFVSSAPHLMRYTDVDGDLQPEKGERFLTGFGGFDHDHSLHSVVAGPDGRLYFNTGNAGPHVVTDKAGWTLRSGSVYTGGSPYNTENEGALKSNDGRIWTGGLQLRMRPDGTGLEVVGHNFRNSYETAVDSYGTMWQNDNDDGVLTCRTSYLMEGANMGFFSEDGTRTWQADRRPGQDVFTAHWHQDDPGVLPAGDNAGAGSPTGVLVYEGDALGERYRGMLLSAEAGRNVIYAYHPEPEGAGYKLERTRLITSVPEDDENYVWNDSAHAHDERKWFRPSDVAVGPDGALYIADWYDPVVGGHRMQEERGVGRIYRVTPKGKALATPSLDLSTTSGQIEVLKSPAPNVRTLGFRALREQGGAVAADVAALLEDANPYVRARAVFLLAQLGPEGKAQAEAVLDHEAPDLRIAAFRALRAAAENPTDVLPYARQLAEDPSPAVRREVAVAMRDVPVEEATDVLLALADGYDGQDRFYVEALGIGFDGKEEALYPELRERFGASDPVGWTAPMAGLAWRLHPDAAVDDLKTRAASADVRPSDRRQALTALAFIKSERAAQVMADLAEDGLADVAEQATWWLRHRSLNDWRAYDLPGLNMPAASVATDRADTMLARLDVLADEEAWNDRRVKAAFDMVGDPFGASLLLALRNEGELLWAANRGVEGQIFANPSPTVRRMAGAFYALPEAKTWDTEAIAQMEGDAERGQAAFYAQCARCHVVGEAGLDVGPALTAIGGKYDRKALLDQLAYPSEGVAHGYETHLVTTKEGAAYYGFRLAEGETVVVKDEYGQQHAVDRADVLLQTTLEHSLMPTPEELGLSEQDLADLAAFLMAQER